MNEPVSLLVLATQTPHLTPSAHRHRHATHRPTKLELLKPVLRRAACVPQHAAAAPRKRTDAPPAAPEVHSHDRGSHSSTGSAGCPRNGVRWPPLGSGAGAVAVADLLGAGNQGDGRLWLPRMRRMEAWVRRGTRRRSGRMRDPCGRERIRGRWRRWDG